MGEIADDHIDWMTGDGAMFRPYRRKPVLRPSCKKCGKRRLFWSIAAGSEWRLVEENGKPHICHAATEDDFETVG